MLLLRHRYAQFLRVWFRSFPRDSFLILNSVEFFEDNRKVLKMAIEFLGLPVPPDDSPAWAAMAAGGPRKSNTERLGWMPEGARRVLSKLYEPHNIALSELLGDKSWLRWNVDLRPS